MLNLEKTAITSCKTCLGNRKDIPLTFSLLSVFFEGKTNESFCFDT